MKKLIGGFITLTCILSLSVHQSPAAVEIAEEHPDPLNLEQKA
jgi:hypothetical protein